MPKVDVFDLTGSKADDIDLPDDVFAAEVNEALLYEAVRNFQAGRRAGTHKTKTRHEVAGSGKKLWKQKGTGRARMGSIRSPLWRHGGTSHGPQPRDYSYSLPKKMLPWRPAFCVDGEAAGWRAGGDLLVRVEGSQSESHAPDVEHSRGHQKGPSGG